MVKASKQRKWNLLGISAGACRSSQLRRAFGNLFLPVALYHPTAKHCSPITCCKHVIPHATPNCLAAEKTTKQSQSTAVTVMSLRGHLGKGGEGRKERQLTLPLCAVGTCPGRLFLLMPTLLGSWDTPSFCRLFFYLQWQSLLRNRCCLSFARSWGRLKLINTPENRKKREEPVFQPLQRGKWGGWGIWRAGREGHEVSPEGTVPP